jgi:hypothetical protein
MPMGDDNRRQVVPPAFWLVSLAFGLLFLMVGLAVGAAFLSRDVVVERPVEIERVVETKVEVPAGLTEAQKRQIRIGEDFLAAAAKPNVAYRESAVMPVLGKVRVLALMSDELDQHLSKEPFEREVAAALAAAGVAVSPVDGNSDDFNTTVFVIIELMVQDSTGNLVGELQLNINQTMLSFANGCYRKINVPTMTFGRTIAYGRDNFSKMPSVARELATEAAQVLLKADEVGRREAAGK